MIKAINFLNIGNFYPTYLIISSRMCSAGAFVAGSAFTEFLLELSYIYIHIYTRRRLY
jgi:hypothetical protein